MQGNPHFRIATERLTQAPRPKGSLGNQIHFTGDALAQAVLALAYEQRTANLIAMRIEHNRVNPLPSSLMNRDTTIDERLGINVP